MNATTLMRGEPTQEVRLPLQRDVLLHRPSHMHHRVLQVTARDFHVIPLGRGAERAWPERRSGSLIKLIDVGEYFFLPTFDKEHPVKTAGELPAGYQLFCVAFADVSRLLTPQGRFGLLIELRKERPTLSTSLFYRLARRWLTGGMTPDSLKQRGQPAIRLRLDLDEGELRKMTLKASREGVRRQCDRLIATPTDSPAPVDCRDDGTPRVRRAPAHPSQFRTDKFTLRLFLSYYDAKLKKGPEQTLLASYERMLEKEFAVEQPFGPAEPFPSHAVPSFKAYEYWYYKLTDFRERRVAAKGSHEYELNGRGKLGQQVTVSFAAGDASQLDATVWNIGIVTKIDRVFCGYPIVFRIRCMNTGMLLGLGVSLESASWMGAASAIANCLVDKREFCARYGLDIDAFEWFIAGLPPVIIADCGETYNFKPTRFIAKTGIDLVNVKPGRGDLKGGVESDFRVLQVALNGKTPGAIISEHEAKTGKKWALKTTLDLDQFMALLLAIELKKMKTPHRRTKQMRSIAAAGVSTAPCDQWKHLVATNGCALRRFDLSEVQLSLMEMGRTSITSEGLYFKGLFYREDQLAAAHAFAKARRSGRRTVAVAFDKRLVDRIFLVRGEETSPSGYVQCDLEERVDQRGYRGMTFREVGALQELQAQARDAQRKAELMRSRQLDDFCDAVLATSAAQTREAREANPMTDGELLSGMPKARLDEANRTSPSQAFVPNLNRENTPVPASPSTAPPASAPVPMAAAHPREPIDDLVFFDEDLIAFDNMNKELSHV